MRVFSSTFFPLVKEYLGVKLTDDKPFLKTEDKIQVTSCALNALSGYTKPEIEQEIILDLLIRKLERQDISDPRLLDGLDKEEAHFVRKEVDHLLAHVFDKMKEKRLDPEGIRKARHKLALELSRHKNNHFHHSVELVRNFNGVLEAKNRDLAERENPLAAASSKAIDEAAKKEMNRTGSKRMGLTRETMSAFYLKNPAEVFAKPLNLGADVRRHVNYLSARIGSTFLFRPLAAEREFENVEEYLSSFCEGLRISENAKRRIMTAWKESKSPNFDASFDKFHHQLATGDIEGETGKKLARLFTAMSQIHYLGAGGYIKRIITASERQGAKGIAYQFDGKGAVAVKSHCTFHRPDCEIKVLNTMKSDAANPSEWTSKIEVVITVHIGRSDKETRERLKQIEAEVVRPLQEHGFHVRLTA